MTWKNTLMLHVLYVFSIHSAWGQNFDPALAAALQSKIDSIRVANNVKGISSCIIYPGVGTWKGVSGISHPGTPIHSEMEFGIASNTKLFTGVLMLKLEESGLIDLEDSLHSYLPSYNHIDSTITIRQLLNHTSGLDDVTSVPGYNDSILNDPYRVYTAGELVTWAGPPLFAPGNGWSYCNTNYLLAGMIAESVTGQSYGQLLRDSILTPLQLDSTFLDVYDSISYTIAHPWQGGTNNISIPRISLNSAAWAAGAMYSTSGEMAQWYHALMNGQVLGANAFNEMTTFVGSGNYSTGISENIVLGRTVWTHGGSIWGGYNSSMMYDTASGIIICVLINQFPAAAYQVSVNLLSTILNNPVGVQESIANEPNIRIFPNPAFNEVRIDMPQHQIKSVEILDLAGQQLSRSLQNEVDVSQLASGMYVIRIHTEQGIHSTTWVKQ